MFKKLAFLLLITFCCSSYAQVIQNPVADCVEAGRTTGAYYSGRAYYKWIIDINHDGIDDVLLSLKKRPDELAEEKEEDPGTFNPNELGFLVYLGVKDGGYIKAKRADVPGGMGFGIAVNVSKCYVGYIDEVKQYGIVTIEKQEVDSPSGKGLPVPKKQIYCYTIEGNQIKRTNLTPLLGLDEKSPIYEKYLTESKRTKVQLQEVTP